MKLLVVLAAMLCVVNAATTQWPEHDCSIDHRPVPDNPHAYEVSDLAGNWEMKMCEPPHLVFGMSGLFGPDDSHEHLPVRCWCWWADPKLTYGNCSDVNRPSTINPDLDYMFEYWHPVDNMWKERNCHDTFPPGFDHNNQYVFFNESGCRCDWKPGHPVYVGPPATPDCTLEMDIEMNKQPPNDTQGSFVQPDCPFWTKWPPKVALETVDGRPYMKCNDCLLKSWHLANAEKKDACMYFGLYSTADDHPEDYQVVLADSCITYAGVFPATFLFEYRASPMSFRVTYRGGVWTYSPGGSGVDRWVDLVFCYRSDSWFTIYVDGFEVPVDDGNNPPEPWADGVNHYLKLQNCHLGICGDILNNGTKYTGCFYWFQEMAGGACPIDLRPLPPHP